MAKEPHLKEKSRKIDSCHMKKKTPASVLMFQNTPLNIPSLFFIVNLLFCSNDAWREQTVGANYQANYHRPIRERTCQVPSLAGLHRKRRGFHARPNPLQLARACTPSSFRQPSMTAPKCVPPTNYALLSPATNDNCNRQPTMDTRKCARYCSH